MPGYADPGFDTLALHAGAAPDPRIRSRHAAGVTRWSMDESLRERT